MLAILTIAMKHFQSDSQYISFAKTSDSPQRYTRHETTHISYYTIFCAKLKCLTSCLHLGFRSVLCEKEYWMADIKRNLIKTNSPCFLSLINNLQNILPALELRLEKYIYMHHRAKSREN